MLAFSETGCRGSPERNGKRKRQSELTGLSPLSVTRTAGCPPGLALALASFKARATSIGNLSVTALRVEGGGTIGFCSLSLGLGSERNGTGNIVNGIPDGLCRSLCRRSGGGFGLRWREGCNYLDWKKGHPWR